MIINQLLLNPEKKVYMANNWSVAFDSKVFLNVNWKFTFLSSSLLVVVLVVVVVVDYGMDTHLFDQYQSIIRKQPTTIICNQCQQPPWIICMWSSKYHVK